MAKDLLYRGLEAFAPEVDEEEKRKGKKEPVIDDGTGKLYMNSINSQRTLLSIF